MKKKILVPVDFSDASRNAFVYAREMARIYDADLEVLHVYPDIFVAESYSDGIIGKNKEDLLATQLEDFVHDFEPKEGAILTSVKVHKNLIKGTPINSILKKSEEEEFMMIIMGNTGSHSGMERIFGSVSSDVAQKANCPVLLIPQTASFKAIENILYASNIESANQNLVDQMAQMANIFRATLHFIHIRDENDKEDFTQTEEELFQILFKDGDPAFSINLAAVQSDSVMNGLYIYAEDNEIDLIVVANQHRNFIKTFLGKSITQKMAINLKHPMLVYHLS